MSWSAANNADVLAQNGQLMCFVQTLCATCQGTLHALQWLWTKYTAKCQTFIKLLNSFHARAELLCGRNKDSEKMTLVWMSAEARKNRKAKKKTCINIEKLPFCPVSLHLFVYERRNTSTQVNYFKLIAADWRSHRPHRAVTSASRQCGLNAACLSALGSLTALMLITVWSHEAPLL